MKRTWAKANAHEYGQLGIIESVKLQNFMCHDNLSFDFDPHMNFIVGRNGSGKSAIITGIILALGGKASATGRFYNVKGFIKTGKHSAVVSVTLKNCGPDAYKPEDYGAKITIERHFYLEGHSNYKLKSESGKITSSSKEELTNILSIMDIQIENPVTVLVQDTSKNFLLSKNSKGDKLFKLFYEGTGLSKVYDDYNRALLQSEEAKLELNNKKDVVLQMEKDVKSTKVLLDKSAKINELEKELLWSIVIQFESQRDEEEAALEQVQNAILEQTQRLNCYEEEITQISQRMDQAKTEKQESHNKMATLRTNIQETHSRKSIVNSELREVEGTLKRHKREIEKMESLMLGVEDQINQARMQNQMDLDEEKIKHELKKKNLQNEIMETHNSIDKWNDETTRLNDKIEAQNRKIAVCNFEMQELINEKNRKVKEKQQIINGLQNRLHVFGVEMEAVLKDIKDGIAAGIFKKTPIGPLGQYIDVKDPEWTFAVQECLQMSLLKSFVCDNNEDGEQLSKIFSKHYSRQRPSIIISKFASQVYDVSAHKCVCQYPTVLDMLNIRAVVVTNCLIDQKQIENILLIKNPVEARNLMLRNPPSKCSYAYSCNGDQFCHSPVRKYSCRNKNKLCVLRSFQKEDIIKKEEEIKNVEKSISDKQKLKNLLAQELNVMEAEVKKGIHKIKNLKLKQHELRMKLKNEESSFVELKDISSLQADLDALKAKKEELITQIDDRRRVLKGLAEKFGELDQNLRNFSQDLQMESSNFTELSKKLEENQNQKEKLDSLGKKLKSQLAKLQEDLKSKKESAANCNGTVKISTERALKACDRINTERSADTIRRLLNEMRNKFQKQKNVDRESLLVDYKRQVEEFNKAKLELIRLEKINDRLVSMISDRFREFQKICKNTSVSLTCTFTTLLKENNFIGYPDVNFKTKTLDIFAKPENSKTKFGNKPNSYQLSGGERSYVTIAFLLALWDRIHTPFRILDEYDVFMDSNNRHRSINLLINAAKSNKKIQYIFLSPLELPHIEDCSHVKVHRMQDPRSN